MGELGFEPKTDGLYCEYIAELTLIIYKMIGFDLQVKVFDC